MKKKTILPRINIYALIILHCGSLVSFCASIFTMGIAFWVSLGVFVITSLYIQYDNKRLIKEIDDLFGESDIMR